MLVCALLCAHCTRDRGCGAHPAFPAPSTSSEGAKLMKTSGISCRENADVYTQACLIVNASLTTSSRAERSNPSSHSLRHGLLRSARNDGTSGERVPTSYYST